MATVLPSLLLLALILAPAPPSLATHSAPSSSQPVIVLELAGPLPPDCARIIEGLGAEVIGYLPPYSFLLLLPRGPGPLSSSPLLHIESLRPLLLEEKLSPPLRELPEGYERLKVLFAGERAAIEPRIRELGVEVLLWGNGYFVSRGGEDKVLALASLGQVYWLEPAPVPEFLNDLATRTLGARQRNDGPYENNGLSLWSYNSGSFEGTTGAGVNVSVVDTGIDGSHPAFEGRKVAYKDYSGYTAWTDEYSSARGHGTMCAGIVAGSGAWRPSDPSGQPGKYAGIAPGAGLIGQAIPNWTYSVERLCRDAHSLGAFISSNSWGLNYFTGDYISDCADYDRYVRDSDPNTPGDQPLVVVFSAGNSGPTGITVCPPSTAKNVISVGATGNDRSGSYGYVSSGTIVSFSSRGPCDDGRIKPDVVAPGVDTYTTSALYNAYKGYLGTVPDDPDSSSYFVGGGTSASCPYVAGACALVTSYWRQHHGVDPSPALIKALLINGAEPLPGYAYPGPDQGWGRVNVTRSIVPYGGRSILTFDQTSPLNQGGTSSKMLRVYNERELKVTLVWTDRPGTPYASKALVNDLDLVVTDPDGNVYYGNNFAGGHSVPGGSPDERNNVEGLLLPFPKNGKWWVNVSARSVPYGPQDFALVISGAVAEISADPAAESVSVSPATLIEGEKATLSFTVRNLGHGTASAFPYKIYIDGQPLATGDLPSLPPGETVEVGAEWTALRGAHAFSLSVDPDGLVDELDEGNNHIEIARTVLHYGVGASLSPPEILLDPGGSYVLEGVVENTGTAPDTVQLGASSPSPGWSASVERTSLSIGPGEKAKVGLVVVCPEAALAGEDCVLTLAAVSTGNSSYRAEASARAVTRQVYGISIPSSPPPVEILPWETASFNITISNTGNGPDVVNVEAFGDRSDWSVEQSAQTLSIPARSWETLEVRVTPHPASLAGNSSTTILTATSSGALAASVELRVSVAQFYNITLTLLPLEVSAPPGGSVSALFFVTNSGNGPDNVSVELELPPGWEAPLEPSLPLGGYESFNGSLSVRVPPSELAGDFRVSLTVRSESGIERREGFEVHVQQVYAAASKPSPRKEVVYPGEAAFFYISVTNLGNGRDAFDVFPSGLPEGVTVARLTGPVPLGHGETAAVAVTLTVSERAPAGEMGLIFRATSRGDPRAASTSEVVLVVLPLPEPPSPPAPPASPLREVTLGGWELCTIPVLLAATFTILLVAVERKAPHTPPSANF
ncbi:MAG: S8 family serine peptidase [Thermoplasmata archaeon]